MWTGLWILWDALFVVFLLLHLFARRQMQMLLWSGMSRDDEPALKVARRIRLFRNLWMASMILMIVSLLWALKR